MCVRGKPRGAIEESLRAEASPTSDKTVSAAAAHVNASSRSSPESVLHFPGFPRHWRRERPPITLLHMPHDAESSDRHDATRREPAEAVRAGVTVALAIYLVGLVLAIAANSSSGTSALVGTIKGRLFAPLLQPAWLDLGFDQRLTYGIPDDADHDLVIAPRGGGVEPLRFPGSRRGEQAARWRRLARTIAVGGVDADGSVVAAGVGRGAFAPLGRDDVVVRVDRLPQPDRAGAGGIPADRAYLARVRQVEGETQLVRDEPRGELAPLAKPREAAP